MMREAVRELGSVVTASLGLGEDDTPGAPVHRGARYVLVQTVLAALTGAGLLLIADWAFHGGLPLGVALPLLPLAATVFRSPAWRPTVVALAAGVVVAVAAWAALRPVVAGFWLWYSVAVLAALVAGPLHAGQVSRPGRRG